MAKIVITADDFGYSDGICKSILELLDKRAISGTSLMCAAIGAEDRLRRWNVASLQGLAGVHLQLTGGTPISPADKVSTLIDHHSGQFRNPRDGQIPNLTEVDREWRRQVELAETLLGGPPTHLDSHHGVHRIPEFFDIYLRLATELGVPIRGVDGTLGERMRADRIPGTVAIVREWTGRSLGAKVLREMVDSKVKENPGDMIEVISHPGYNDDYLSSISSLSNAREEDHKALSQLADLGWPEANGHEMVSHREILNQTRNPSLGKDA